MNVTNAEESNSGQVSWIWPLSFSPAIRHRILATGDCMGSIGTVQTLVLAVIVGVLPISLAVVVQMPFDRCLTALLVLPLLLGATRRDSLAMGLGILILSVVAHCAVVITLAAKSPDALFALFPDGADYWARSHTWITTGESREYSLGWWLPAHIQLLGGAAVFTYTSHGFLTLWQGLYEVDLMNCYVGQLVAHSENAWLAVAVGWHPWSVLRGIGYLLVTFEVSSYSLERMTTTKLSTRRRRLCRWAAGVTFLILDGVVKFLCLESVRQLLESNLVDSAG